MKKVLSIAIMLTMLISCQQSKYGQAGENAVQYVYEQFPNIREDIKNVEVFYEDSVLLTDGLSYMIIELLNKKADFYDKKIGKEEYIAYYDSIQTLIFDIDRSWTMQEWNDSLQTLTKYKNLWHKAFMIEITMKSSKQMIYRICMDWDGTTPYINQDEIKKEIDEFQKELNNCI
jgi:hypothetical protein